MSNARQCCFVPFTSSLRVHGVRPVRGVRRGPGDSNNQPEQQRSVGMLSVVGVLGLLARGEEEVEKKT